MGPILTKAGWAWHATIFFMFSIFSVFSTDEVGSLPCPWISALQLQLQLQPTDKWLSQMSTGNNNFNNMNIKHVKGNEFSILFKYFSRIIMVFLI